MNTKIIKIRDGEEYITLGVLLKIGGVIQTGGMAKFFLQEHTPLINGEPDNRRGRKLYAGDTVTILNFEFELTK